MKKKAKKDMGEATRASVKKEMTKPRMAKSARIAERNLETTAISERLANAPMPDLPHNELDRYPVKGLHGNQPAAFEESIGDKGISR
jgi:hypothetical protein